MKPSRIDPATFRFAAQHLNHCATAVHPELHLSGLIGTASYPDLQKIRIIRFFCENRLHWQFEVRLLPFTIMYLRVNHA